MCDIQFLNLKLSYVHEQLVTAVNVTGAQPYNHRFQCFTTMLTRKLSWQTSTLMFENPVAVFKFLIIRDVLNNRFGAE